MIRIDDKSKCCGCKTCSIVCPKSCISFSKDSIGAMYPIVDQEKCINCGKCETVCPILKKFDNSIGRSAYAAFSKHDDIRFRGSSGGLFETVSSFIINKSGCVFASKFDETLRLKGFEAQSITEVQKLTKSKYLQSDNISLFPIIRQRVLEGKQVLFCGTPCQVAALKLYLGKLSERENVLLMDFFCHGVPSQDLFDKCIRFVESREGIHITSYEFRTKKVGGATPHYYTTTYEKNGASKKRTRLYIKDPFYLGFQKYITLRDSCYRCPYGKGNHCGDITVGDFHDIDKYVEGINRFDGVSSVLINTDKGERIWSLIKDQLNVHEVDINTLYKDGIIYAGGTKEPKLRAAFLNDIETKQFDVVVGKWFNSKAEWKKEIYYILPAPIRKLIKGVVGI